MVPETVRPLVALTGPTATGKSELALAVCAAVGGEIISVDSAACYIGCDIGTSKPTLAMRQAVPHHCIDLVPADRPFSVAEYRAAADAAIASCQRRGRLPVLVGGTGLYLRQVLQRPELPAVPPQPALRAALAAQDPQALYLRLQEADPIAAAAIHPHNVRRVIRALEVLAVTGEPISAAWARPALPRRGVCLIVVDRPQAVLVRRIEQRVAAMLAAGLVQEVAGLLAAGVPPGAQSLQALGYRQTVAALQAGRTGPEDMAALAAEIARETVRYARRQRTWLRREGGAHHLDAGERPAAALLPAVLDLLSGTAQGEQTAPRA